MLLPIRGFIKNSWFWTLEMTENQLLAEAKSLQEQVITLWYLGQNNKSTCARQKHTPAFIFGRILQI